MVSLTDKQLQIVTLAAHGLDYEKRSLFLERCGAMLAARRRYNDDVVAEVVGLALLISGLVPPRPIPAPCG